MHIILVMRAPHEQKIIRIRDRDFEDVVENRLISRVSPYPPSFSRMAARIMDPATGASTWAFGSQRWNPYIGIFIKNAIIDKAHQILKDSIEYLGAHRSSTFGNDRVSLEE